MHKPSWLFWVVSIFAILWSAFGVYDYVMTSTGDEKYLKDRATATFLDSNWRGQFFSYVGYSTTFKDYYEKDTGCALLRIDAY